MGTPMPFGPSPDLPPFAHHFPSLSSSTRPPLTSRLRSTGRQMAQKFKTIGFTRKTGGTNTLLKAALENASKTPPLPSPSTFVFRHSDVEEYADIFTHAPLTRAPTRTGEVVQTPPPSVALDEPAPMRLPIDENLRLATPHPSLTHALPVIPPPPGAHYGEDPDVLHPPSIPGPDYPEPDGAADSSSLTHYPLCRLEDTQRFVSLDGFAGPHRLYRLMPVEEKRSPLTLQTGVPFTILDDWMPEGRGTLWPMEVLREDVAGGTALIIAGYRGIPLAVQTELREVRMMMSRKKVWAFYASELEEAAKLDDEGEERAEHLHRMHEVARATVIWRLTCLVSNKTVPPDNHPAPGNEGLHIVRLLGMLALPGAQ
ncbi:hypothetical protein BD626DRAFT_625602 [Schizophyllum amplum]|uniref:Uncharacterized protein n=1 Tax=Schizophyllum amplum TaxID=97359 RepID=A0A550D069_9AGAR|nr:hypothetical protein BD626DRAFT_625602 [Auriculariopsis ampla]